MPRKYRFRFTLCAVQICSCSLAAAAALNVAACETRAGNESGTNLDDVDDLDTQAEHDSSGDDEDADEDDVSGQTASDGDDSLGDDANDVEYSYIWIANSTQGTVSKINTRTMVEEGRYRTNPDGLGDPSRTSVGLSGNVAVANRNGGVIKIIARPEECRDTNGDGEIQTSKGADDILAWGQDECVAWYVEMPYASQRAIAWTAATELPQRGEFEGLWVTGVREDEEVVHVHLLDGNTGQSIDEVVVTGMPGATPRERAYGGAVDGNNDFWFSNFGAGKLARVAFTDRKVDQWDKPHNSYGITVDPDGRPWVCGVTTARFDPATESWAEVTMPSDMFSFVGGCMVDGHSRLWKDVANSILFDGYAVIAIDTESLEVVERIEIPTHAHGISIDFDGRIWAVSGSAIGPIPTGGEEAYRIDPETKEVQTVRGLVGAYTYSDMTGFALGSVQPLE
jgi:hypothetical protein